MSPPEAQQETNVRPTAEELERLFGVRDPERLRRYLERVSRAGFVVEGLLPARSIGLLVGESGLGKSPFLYQMAICVAAGIPFLGFPTRQGRVLYCDFENSVADQNELVERLSGFLGLHEPPADLLLWNVNDCSERFGPTGYTVEAMIETAKPDLAIVDPLSAWKPDAEERNSDASRLMQGLRRVIRRSGATTVLSHHLRKPSDQRGSASPHLDESDSRSWLRDARGASAVVNGSDARFGLGRVGVTATVAEVRTGRVPSAELVCSGYVRIRGQVGRLYLGRVLDDDGEPLGYIRVQPGSELLDNDDQRRVYDALPVSFTTGAARQAYGRGDQATAEFLTKCVRQGLLRKVARGQWQKVCPE